MRNWNWNRIFGWLVVVVIVLVFIGAMGTFYLLPSRVEFDEGFIVKEASENPIPTQSEMPNAPVVADDDNETNLERAKRLADEEKSYEKRVPALEREARNRGWNIQQSYTISYSEYGYFLERLLAVDDVVNTGEVEIVVSRWFSVSYNKLRVPYDASMDEVLEFLKN